MTRQLSRNLYRRHVSTGMQGAFLISILLALAALTHTAQAQDWSKLPELPVWYEEVNGIGGSGLSYLPDFDIANGGKNALYCGGKVIYNRFKGDTTTMFSFPEGGSKMIRGDFNGDGITDYFSNRLYLYQGIKNTAPSPKRTGSYWMGFNSSNYGFIAASDINQDGKDDIVYAHSESPDTVQPKGIGSLILGGDDLSDLELVKLPCTPTMYTDLSRVRVEEQCLMDAYYLEGKGMRIITLTWIRDKKAGGITQGTLRLWSVALSGTQNNRTVKYELLSSTVISQGNSADLQITFESFHIPKEGIRCIKLEQTMYDLSSDSIKKRYVYKRGVGSRHDYSLHDKTKPGWLFVTEINGVIHLPITGGNPLEWNEPFGRIPFSVELPNENEPLYLENLSNAGDLNNDGIGELATVYVSGSHRLFRIYAGTPHSTDVVNHDLSQYKIDVRNPLSPNESYIINVHSLREMPGTLQLYSLRGELVRTIWEGMLLNEVTPIVFSSLGLPRGVYNLRLQAGATVLDKPIIIE